MKLTIQRLAITFLAIVEFLAVITVIKTYLFPLMEQQTYLGVSLVFLFVTQIRLPLCHEFGNMLGEILEESRKTSDSRSKEDPQ